MATLNGLLASLLNPNPGAAGGLLSQGTYLAQTGLAPEQLARYHAMSGMGAAPHAGPSAPAMAPQAPTQPDMTQTASTRSSGGIGDFLGNLLAPKSAQKNRTVQLLMEDGLDEGTATLVAQDKQSLNHYLRQRAFGEGQQPSEFQERAAAAQQFGLDPSSEEGRSFILTGEMPKPVDGPTPTDDMREYQEAVNQGFTGTFMDFMIKMKEAGRNQVNVNTGVKLPTGFQWKDPENQELGVEPIPGGPATQIPGELAARVGGADAFLKQLPQIKEKVASGEVTGPIDKTTAAAGVGEAGQTYQQIESGVDILMRLLTGAGMNQTEAAAYARRYLPTYADDSGTMLQKLDRLERELVAARDTAMRGRGGSAPAAPPPGDAIPPTGRDRHAPTPKRLKFNPATGELE